MTPQELEAIADPALRAQAAVSEMQAAEEHLEALRFVRNVAFAEMHAKGESVRSIADRFGVSKTLVATITG